MRPIWHFNPDSDNYRLTGFRIQSLVCFVVTLSVAILLRIASIVWGVASRCVEADQFWFEPYKHHWPVAGVFLLTIFLLLAWNSIILLNQRIRNRNDWLLTSVNFVAIIAMLALSVPAYQSAQLRYDKRNPSLGQWLIPKKEWWHRYDDKCRLAIDYLGHWEVIDKNLPPGGAEFPGQHIEFRQSLTFVASTGTRQEPISGSWDPPSFNTRLIEQYRGTGELYWADGSSTWNFRLEGDRLYLTTPEWLDWHFYSSVTLQRVREE